MEKGVTRDKLLPFLLAAFLVAADQLTKAWIVHAYPGDGDRKSVV